MIWTQSELCDYFAEALLVPWQVWSSCWREGSLKVSITRMLTKTGRQSNTGKGACKYYISTLGGAHWALTLYLTHWSLQDFWLRIVLVGFRLASWWLYQWTFGKILTYLKIEHFSSSKTDKVFDNSLKFSIEYLSKPEHKTLTHSKGYNNGCYP